MCIYERQVWWDTRVGYTAASNQQPGRTVQTATISSKDKLSLSVAKPRELCTPHAISVLVTLRLLATRCEFFALTQVPEEHAYQDLTPRSCVMVTRGALNPPAPTSHSSRVAAALSDREPPADAAVVIDETGGE
ncbi:hypothetical protein ON010_g10243 [Phytophthora cinnamomi]|nr:hypothetical protein ON010_g10243 [Phytophthora cinnamomi]